MSTRNNAITFQPREAGATCTRCLLEAVTAVSGKPLCLTCAAHMKAATGPKVCACSQCGDVTNLYVDVKPICNRCDRQWQAVRRLRQMLNEQDKNQPNSRA